MKKALIAMSGGVDSSVAAALTKEKGYECIGCMMELFDGTDTTDARTVADTMGMDFHSIDLREDFRCQVIEKFVDSYSSGLTPNPCIDCNRQMKFGHLYAKALELGCELIVTGHYARVEENNGAFALRKGLDQAKDQSYVLYNMSQELLSHTYFPLGELTKEQVRRIAEEKGFANADKAESQDICFVPDGDYAGMIRGYSGREFPPGKFLDRNGREIGTHKGIIHYTIGQHKKLGQSFGRPMYVCGIDAAANTVTLGDEKDVFSDRVIVKDFNWISGKTPNGEIHCRVRLRYKQKEQPALVTAKADGKVEAKFEEPQRAATPGQAAVLYDGDAVIGGGTII